MKPNITIEEYAGDQLSFVGATLYIDETEYGFLLSKMDYPTSEITSEMLDEFVQRWTERAEKLGVGFFVSDDICDLVGELLDKSLEAGK